MCHVYVRADNLAAVLISDHEYPRRVAHTLITKMMDEFAAKNPPSTWPSLKEATTDFPQINVYLAKYQNPVEADALTKMQNDLDETKIILVKLDDLFFFLAKLKKFQSKELLFSQIIDYAN